MADPTKCAHTSCSCVCTDGKKYCCQMCEDSVATTSLSCDCQHAGCAGKL